jgi:hypothetical protein
LSPMRPTRKSRRRSCTSCASAVTTPSVKRASSVRHSRHHCSYKAERDAKSACCIMLKYVAGVIHCKGYQMGATPRSRPRPRHAYPTG